jgi:hypothetical protein
MLPGNAILSGTGAMFITTCRAVKTNHAEIPIRIRTTPKITPTTHLIMINGFGLLGGGLELKTSPGEGTRIALTVTELEGSPVREGKGGIK